MDVMKELTAIVSRSKIRKVELLHDEESDSMLLRLYNGLVEDAFGSDEEAKVFLYGDSKAPAYRKLKSSLKERLYNHLFFLDTKQPSYNDRQRAYYEGFRYWAAAKILLGKNARKAGIELAEKLFKEARAYEFTELALDISHTLRLHYGSRMGDAKRFAEYNALYHHYEQLYRLENAAEEYHTRIMLDFVQSKSAKEEKSAQALEFFTLLHPHLAEHDSYLLHFYAYLIEMAIYTAINDYRGALAVSHRMVTFFEAKPYTASTPLQVGYYQQFVCYLQLQDFAGGGLAAKRCKELVVEGSFNWFKYQELYVLLCFRNGAYQVGLDTLFSVKAHPRFSFLDSHSQEYWRLIEAYFYHLYLNQEVDWPEAEAFRIGKFLNETPIYLKDKAGIHIPILIVQIAILLGQGQFAKVTERIGAIEKYCTRHLKKQEATLRSYYFIRILLLIPDAGFHREAVVRKAESLWQKLQALPLADAGQSFQVELIPYETLWGMMRDVLPRQFPRLRHKGG